MSIYQAKKVGNTVSGNKYIILQDGPKSFHISVSNESNTIYDYFFDPPNLEFFDNNILLLETELLSKTP